MKKNLLLFLSLLVLSITATYAQLGVGQQFDNNDFEIWEQESGLTSSFNHPKYWNTINTATDINHEIFVTAQLARDASFVTECTDQGLQHPGSTGGSCVQLMSVYKVIKVANGGLTSGRFNVATSDMTSGNYTKNCTYTASTSGYNKVLTAYPDSMYIWAKTVMASNQNARINVVLHNNSLASNSSYYQDPAPTSSSNSVVNTSGSSNEAKVVAKATSNFNTSGYWTKLEIEFDYDTYISNSTTPSFILATFSTNQIQGGGKTGDKLFLDDIILIYNTRLKYLNVNGQSIANFNPNVLNYSLDLCQGADFPTITFDKQSAHATATCTHPATVEEPYTEIKVTHRNQESDDNVSKVYRINYNIISTDAPTFASSTVNKCEGVPVQITPTNENISSCKWYTQSEGGDAIYTGKTYTCQSNSTVTYYVSSFHNTCGESQTRTPITVDIVPTPTIPSLSNVDRCGAGEVTLSVENPNNDYTYTWKQGNNTVNTGSSYTPNLSSTTTYSVTASQNGCASSAASVTATINSIPSNPTVQGASRCGAGEVTLQATPGTDGTCQWFAAAEGGDTLKEGNNYSLSLNATTSYYVHTYVANTGCHSSRVPVTATINDIPAAPVMAAAQPVCYGNDITLSVNNPSESYSYKWYDPVGGESIHTGTSYTIEGIQQETTLTVKTVSENSCLSEGTDITAQVNELPGIPNATGASVCVGESVTLHADIDNGMEARWYDVVEGGESLSSQVDYSPVNLTVGSHTFYVSQYNTTTGCEGARTAVVATVKAAPVQPVVGDGARCGEGSVVLTVNNVPSSQAPTYQWFATAEGGTVLNEGASYATQSLTETTTYYVQAVEDGCISARTAVMATIHAIPSTPLAQNVARCGNGTVVINAEPADNCVCKWYDSQDVAIVSGLSNDDKTLTTSSLQIGNYTYNVKSYNETTGCYGEAKVIEVVVSPNPGTPVVSNKSRCGAGDVELTAQPGNNANTCRWYANDELLATATNYTAEGLEATTTFKVSSYNSESGCESSKSNVIATIHAPELPSVTGNDAICGSGARKLTATPGANATICRWFVGDDTISSNVYQTGNLLQTANYQVQSYNAYTKCASENVNVAVVVNEIPAAPIVVSDTVCEGSQITLSAVAAEGNTCRWFAQEQDDLPIYTGNEYQPQELPIGTTTFYVDQQNDETQCVSSKTLVYARINAVYHVDYPVVACDEYTWNNETFTKTGNYEHILPAIDGCDSIITLQLTINHSKETHIDTTVCDVFAWNGQDYTESDNLRGDFSTINQCDSTVYINLTVKHSSQYQDHIFLCSNELPFNYYDLQQIEESGNYEIHTTNSQGCDSVIYLTVTVNTQPAVATKITPASRCGEGEVALSAQAGANGAICRWYVYQDAEEPAFEGAQFTINNLSETTTYFVSSYNDYNGHPCESARQEVTATINEIPQIPQVDATYRCGDGAVEFSTYNQAENINYRWYLTANATTPQATAADYSPVVYVDNGTTSFYVESFNTITNCKSARIEVLATAYPTPQNPSLQPMSHCGPNDFNIGVPAIGSYYWYNGLDPRAEVIREGSSSGRIEETTSFFISHVVDYQNISCESERSELVLTIYPVYEPQTIFDTICQGETYSKFGISETFDQAGEYERVINEFSSNLCDSLVTLSLFVKENKIYDFAAVACDSYDWNGEIFNQSEDIVRHFTSSNGCDSTVTLHLTVNYSAHTSFEAVACDSYSWNDSTYTQSGDYEQQFKTIHDCDSIVTLHLTIYNSITTEFSETACDSYTWNDSTYTQSGNYEQQFETSHHCDSTVTLHLTINHSDNVHFEDFVCAGAHYNNYGFDTTITVAGVYQLIHQNVNAKACDSTTTLILTVNPIYNRTVNMTICETALPFTWADTTYPAGTPSGEYQHTYYGHTTLNCDSIVNLNLTISNKYITNLNEDICEGSSYYFADKDLTETGVYYDTLTAVNGCDSIVILNLAVHQLDTTYFEDSICEGEDYQKYDFDIHLPQTGVKEYQRTIPTVFGCDSTVILTLTVNRSYRINEYGTICDSELPYAWRGQSLTSAGEYEVAYETINDCDSIYHLYLTVLPTYYFEDTVVMCSNESLTWHNRTIANLSAGPYTYWDSLQSANFGCDSVYKLALTVNPVYHFKETDTMCSNETYVWEGHNRTFENLEPNVPYTYWDSLQTINGCDSVYELALTVYPSYRINEYDTICDSELPYTWRGQALNATGEYEDRYSTVNNCDSVYHLYLTVTPTYYFEDTVVMCSNDSLTWHNQTIANLSADNYIYWDSLQTANFGCDSIYKLNLIVNQVKRTEFTQMICEGDVYQYNKKTYDETGDYEHHFTTVQGCDSMVILHLIVNRLDTTYLEDSICEGGNYTSNGFNIITPPVGLVRDTLHTRSVSTGCDSTVYLLLTVNPVYELSFESVICKGERYHENGFDTLPETAGTHVIVNSYQTAAGCDSIRTLTLTVNPTSNIRVVDTACGEYVINRITYLETYTESGTYVDTLKTINDCDSIVTYCLTIYPKKDTTLEQSICEGESYTENGFNIITPQAGLVRDTLYTTCVGTGCDSTVYLLLTVNPSYNQTFDTTVCDEFVWNGNSYTQSGTPTYTYRLATGCDSTVTYNLTVNHSCQKIIDTTVCDQFFCPWILTHAITESDTLVHTYTAANGCDSVVTINLTVNKSVSQNEQLTICQSELPYPWRDMTFSAETEIGSRNVVFHRQTVNGCDSTVTLYLTVNPNNHYEDDLYVMCQGESYDWRNMTITESGIYTDTVANDMGCYDVYSVEVIVNPSYRINEYDTICDNGLPYDWRGQSLTAAGEREVAYRTMNDCDSIYHLYLTVLPTYYFEDTVVMCSNESLTWHNRTIANLSAGPYTYWDSLQSANFGCDSVYKLALTVNPVYHFKETDTMCSNETYVWEGHNRTFENLEPNVPYTYWDSLQTINGCDSVYELALTVYPSYRINEYDTICDSELPYFWRDQALNAAGEYEDRYSTVNDCDSVYVLTLTVYPTGRNIEDASSCSNEAVYEWHGMELTATGVYYDTLATVHGCDSVCEMHYTLLNPTTATFADTICANADYIGYGFELTNLTVGDTTVQRIMDNVAGCDSTITLNLHVKSLSYSSFDVIACEGYLWNNSYYTESGQYQQTFVGANECDSIVTLNLLVDHPVSDTIEVTSCDFYEWDGTTYYQSGIYQKIYPRQEGCDSTAVLMLTVNYSTEATFADTICLGEYYDRYGFDTLALHVGMMPLQRTDVNAAGCDSVIKVNLLVRMTYQTIDTVNTCENQPYQWQGVTCDTSGVYTKIYPTIHGCDSIFILVLRVHPIYEMDVEDTAYVGVPYQNHGVDFTPQSEGTMNIPISFASVHGCDSVINLTLVIVKETSIEQVNAIERGIKLYPNPTDNKFTVISTSLINDLVVFDNSGKAVLYRTVNDKATDVEVESLAAGIYYVRLNIVDGVVHKKLIVRR